MLLERSGDLVITSQPQAINIIGADLFKGKMDISVGRDDISQVLDRATRGIKAEVPFNHDNHVMSDAAHELRVTCFQAIKAILTPYMH